MERLEMVDALRERTNVTYEEARQALEETEWNLLDAIVLLERRGDAEEKAVEERTPDAAKQSSQGRGRAVKRFFSKALKILKTHTLEVSREGRTLFLLPAWAFALLLFFFWEVLFPIMLVALFFGVRYSFQGSTQVESINKVMQQAGNMAEEMKQGFAGEA